MSESGQTVLASRLAVLAGGMDLGTGIGLVCAPHWTLAAMGVPLPGGEAMEFLRFAGVFVGCVGASYFLGLWRGPQALREVFRLTVLFRAAAGAFVALAVARGVWALPWTMVTLTDWTIAAAQLWILRRGRDSS